MAEHGDLAAPQNQAGSERAAVLSGVKVECEQLLAAARTEAEAIRASAQQEAEAIVAQARREAAIIEERSRQEFFWRRRQLRQQQDVLVRWKHAIESRLDSVSSFAVETARDLYEEPESEEPIVGVVETA